MLLHLGDLHPDVFSAVRARLDAGSRLAMAGTCRQARAMCQSSVTTVLVSTSHPPLAGELAHTFPRARHMQLDLCENAEGDPCGSAVAAMRLEHWAGTTPLLLSRLTELRVSINTTNFDHDLNADLVEFITRCTSLEALTVTAADSSGYVSTWHFSGHPAPPRNPHPHPTPLSPPHLEPCSPPAQLTHKHHPTISPTLTHPPLCPTAPCATQHPFSPHPHSQPRPAPAPTPSPAAAMAAQLAAFKARPYLLDPHSWPHYPCLTTLTLNHRLMIQLAPPAALEPPSLLAHLLSTPSLRALSILTLPPTTLDLLPPPTALAPSLTLLKAPAYAHDQTALPAFWHTIGRLPSLASLHLFQNRSPPPHAFPPAPFSVPLSWSSLTGLTCLNLQIFHDPIPLDALSPFTSLHRLSVASAVGGLSHLAPLRHLTYLSLGAAAGTSPDAFLVWGDPDDAVRWGPALQELSLEHCPDGGPAFAAIGRLSSLQVLTIHLADQTPASALKPLAALPCLTKLVAKNALVGPQLCRALCRLPSLRNLHFLHPQAPPRPAPPPDAISVAAFPIAFPALQSIQFHHDSPHAIPCLQTLVLWSSAPRLQHAYAPAPPTIFHEQLPSDHLLLPPKYTTPAWVRALTAGPSPSSYPPDGHPQHPPHPPVQPHFLIATDADLAHLSTHLASSLLAAFSSIRLWFTRPPADPPSATSPAAARARLQLQPAAPLPLAATPTGLAAYAAAIAAGCRSSSGREAAGRPPVPGCSRAAAMRQIEELVLGVGDPHDASGGRWLGDEAVQPFVAAFGATLRRVVLDGCGMVSDALVAALVEACPGLRVLALRGARRLTDRALWPLLMAARGGRRLQVLAVSGAPGVTVVGVTALAAVNAVAAMHVEDCGVSVVDAVTTIQENLHPRGRVRVVENERHVPPQDLVGVEYVEDAEEEGVW